MIVGFHSRDGFYFRREEDGNVSVIVTEDAHANAPVVREITLEATIWASVIAAVSERGETAETFAAAQEFHGAP